MTNIVDFGDYSIEDAEADKAAIASKANFLKLVEGDNYIRPLPPLKGRKPFEVYYQHFITKPDGTKSGFACPQRMAKAPCPVCDRAKVLAVSTNSADQKLAKSWMPKRRILLNVVNRREMEAGVQILAFGKTVYDQLLTIRKDVDCGGNYFHPVDGFDLNIKRSGTGAFDTEYSVLPARKSSPLASSVDEMNNLISSQYDLGAFTKPLDLETILAMLQIGGPVQSHQNKMVEAGVIDTDDDQLNF